MTISDDGNGLAPDRPEGNGLGNIGRRARELGGLVTFPPVDRGCTLQLSIPLRRSTAGEGDLADG